MVSRTRIAILIGSSIGGFISVLWGGEMLSMPACWGAELAPLPGFGSRSYDVASKEKPPAEFGLRGPLYLVGNARGLLHSSFATSDLSYRCRGLQGPAQDKRRRDTIFRAPRPIFRSSAQTLRRPPCSLLLC